MRRLEKLKHRSFETRVSIAALVLPFDPVDILSLNRIPDSIVLSVIEGLDIDVFELVRMNVTVVAQTMDDCHETDANVVVLRRVEKARWNLRGNEMVLGMNTTRGFTRMVGTV